MDLSAKINQYIATSRIIWAQVFDLFDGRSAKSKTDLVVNCNSKSIKATLFAICTFQSFKRNCNRVKRCIFT